nr:kinetochore scaffold 1 isoform X1 [Danio rerio]XP_009304635.1 kinetochore scaffold 1 isoform X1 [Danio rerio]|eukprot:XP_001921879.4 kinetochore scaffold 1 isoform X1 [Danio rerio]
MEQQNLGNEAVKSSKRRLSSILKAPRTSMKVLGVEQEEQKEEIAKPVEKRRNSRRVSFATTNNVRVFTNEAKNESPVLGSIQNLHEERPDEKILRFADEGSHQIKGLETLLHTPLYLTQNKENFFSDPVLQDDYVDRTILLGEDTGYMDITHSHTITFDKDYEIKEEANQDVSFKVAQTVCGDSNIPSQKADKKNVSMDSDFSAFLASMHLPTVNTVKLQKSENELNNASGPANTSISEIDKENFLPSFLTKPQPSSKCQLLQPRGLQRRRSRVSFIENDESGSTMGRTVVTENIDSAQSFTPSVPKNPRSVPIMTSAFPDVSDDMEFTAPVNAKVTGNITCGVQAALDQNRSHYFSEEDNAMEMTGVSDISVRNKDYTVNMMEQSQPSVPKVRRMSSLTVIGNGEITDQSNAGYFQGNLSVAQTTDCDNMEMTEALDVSLQDKEKALFPKVSRRSTFDVFGNGDIVQNKSNSSLMVPPANSDDMEMTEVIDLESKPSVENKLLHGSRKSLPLTSISRKVQEDKHTSIMKENGLHPIPTVNRKTCFNVAENGIVLDYNKSGHLSIAQDDNSGDMEITECRTDFLEIKQSTENKSFGSFWKNLPSSSSSKTVGEDEHTGSVKKEALCSTSSVNKMPCFNSNSDDMEMTQCHTVFLQPKHVSGDESLSVPIKNGPLTSLSGTEGGDEMDMTQVPTGRIILNGHSSYKKEKGESILIPASATSPVHNKSDYMDLTCVQSTFAETSLPCPDEMEFTACVADIASNRTGRTVDITDIRAPFSANQTVIVVEPMEMTEVHMAPFSERKHKAFMTRRKSGARMMSLMCNSGNTEADNCQFDFSNSDNMDMTQCQTAVLEAETSKRATPFNKSRRNLNSASCSPDGMEITQPLTGKIVLKSFASNEESKHQQNPLPEAQSCQMQNESQCMELTCQASASNLAIPYVDDEMELTGCNTIAMDSKSTLASSAAEIKVNESALWASTTVSKCTVSSEEQNEVSEAANCANSSVFPSKDLFDLGGKSVKCSNMETTSYILPDMQVDKNCETALPSNVMANDEDDMQVTKPLTLPIEIEQTFSFNQNEEPNTSSGFRNDKEGHAHNAKARRRSLADFQMELHNMSQRILEEPNLMTVSATAPLPSCTLSENVQNEMGSSAEPASNVTPVVKQKNNSAQSQKTTPFSLNKKSFSSRMSLCGVVPKLPKRATAFTPNKSLPISLNGLPCLELEKHFEVAEQKSNQTVDINDEEFPEMSSEEDLSGSLENWPVSKQDELDESLAVPMKEEFLIDDVFESGTSPSFKRPHPEEEPITPEQTKKTCVSDMGSDCHEAAVQWEGNFTRHAAQNPKAKTIEDTGVSESTLRHSQFDSHMDGMQDNLFDFNKKLEDGSITVNEFLSHFGIKFVIHRSRPSALPVRCGAGETRTIEDLLKEKYISHPKQRVYEQDCKNITEIVERLKEQMSAQEKSLRSINGALQQEICTLSEEQLKSFGSKLKERRAYFGKKSKAVSHEMKGVLYSELIKTTQDAKLSLISKIKETDEMIEDLDGCIKDLETDLASVDAMITGDRLDLPQAGPALKAKEEDLHRLNSAVTFKEREIGELEIQLKTLESQQEKLQGESSSLKSHLATLNSLNEWRLEATDETGALFSFLHKTVHLQVNLQTPAGKEWMTEDVERNVDVVFQLQLDGQKSECHASMIHNLLATKIESQSHWKQRYTTTRHIPELLHTMSLVVGRLRLLGEEIHRLKKWGGLRLRILKITCTDTRVHVIFSSLKSFEKFELSLTVTPDYPFGPLHIQDFKNHMGNTRLDQLEEIISSVKPAKNYLSKILKKIHDDLLC